MTLATVLDSRTYNRHVNYISGLGLSCLCVGTKGPRPTNTQRETAEKGKTKNERDYRLLNL